MTATGNQPSARSVENPAIQAVAARVRALGERGPIAAEVIPFALGLVSRRVKGLGLRPVLRLGADRARAFSENGNLTLDCSSGPLADARAARTGLFLGTAERVLVGHPDGRVEVLHAGRP